MRKPGRQILLLLLPLAAFLALLPLPSVAEDAASEDIPYEKVQHVLMDGVKYLYGQQNADGLWYYTNNMYPVGTTGLVLYALVLSGISPKDAKVQKALVALEGKLARLDANTTTTYELGLAKMALEIIDRKKYRDTIMKLSSMLLMRQTKSGGWTYQTPSYSQLGNVQVQRTDWSNTQYAVLGLAAMERTESKGYAYKGRNTPTHWMKFRDYVLNTWVTADSGWPYSPEVEDKNTLRATPSMTCAGLASTLICYAALNHSKQYPCGSDRALLDKAETSLDYFAKSKSNVLPTTLKEFNDHMMYRFYAMERVGFYTGLRVIGDVDWFQLGAKLCVEANNTHETNGWTSVPGAAFTLMFLSKGRWPLVVNKLKWGVGWNDDALDMLRLTEKASEIFEEAESGSIPSSDTAYLPTPKAGKRCTWGTVTFESPFERVAKVPLLYVTGKKFPEMGKTEAHMLRKYAFSGGTLLFVATDSSKEFDEGFRSFCAENFSGYALEPIDRSHPMFSSWYRSSGGYLPLEGIQGPHGKLMVIYSEKGVACDWEGGSVESRETRLGVSIIKYITDHVPGIWK